MRERVSVLQFEYNHCWIYARRCLKDVFDFASDTCYILGKVTPTHVEIYDEWHPELDRFFEGNYLLVHQNFINRLAHKRGKFDKRNMYA